MSKDNFKRPKAKQASSLGEVLDTILGGDTRGLAYLQICRAWEKYCPGEFAGDAYPLGIRRGTLTLTVAHPAVAHQLSFMKETILDVLNGILGETALQDLRFEVGKIPPKILPGIKKNNTSSSEK